MHLIARGHGHVRNIVIRRLEKRGRSFSNLLNDMIINRIKAFRSLVSYGLKLNFNIIELVWDLGNYRQDGEYNQTVKQNRNRSSTCN